MTDSQSPNLVSRLRSASGLPGSIVPTLNLCAEAADEIERLRAALTLIAGAGPDRAECGNPRFVAARALQGSAVETTEKQP